MLALSPNKLRQIDQELKEAVCAAIVNLTIQRVSGAGSEGQIIYGPNPRRVIISGQLLPRFGETGAVDETTDIRIAALGIDFQIREHSVGEAHAQPKFSIYLRVLPTWDELANERLGLEPNFQLKKDVQEIIDKRYRELRVEKFAAAGVSNPSWKTLSANQRRETKQLRDNLIQEARTQAHREHGIDLDPHQIENVKQAAFVAVEEGKDSDLTEEVEARLPLSRLMRHGLSIPFELLDEADIPGKWRRVDLNIPSFEWMLADSATVVEERLANYNSQLEQLIKEDIAAWLNSEEGRAEAWRDVKVSPAALANPDAWHAFRRQVAIMPVPYDELTPDLRIVLHIDRVLDFSDNTKASIRVSLDNRSSETSRRATAAKCNAVFSSSLKVSIPEACHINLNLDRVEPSYRFRHFMRYPAIGLNNGVTSYVEDARLFLCSTWAPTFVQPRIVPRRLDVEVSFSNLANPDFDIGRLSVLTREYRAWIEREKGRLREVVREGLQPADADRESERLAKDTEAQELELHFIERGIQLLQEAQDASRQMPNVREERARSQLERKAIPYRAWLLTNQSFLNREKGDPDRSWHLFQVAFVISHIPTLASRMEEYRSYQDVRIDEESASLLYFPTGGGKSEAFYGSLVFGIFLDRLRGKHRGVTAMIRYPLRLLTLQQGQRLLKLIVHAEKLRREQKIGTWPFEIGFWVGGGNTPNRYSQVPANAVPEASNSEHPDDSRLAEIGAGLSEEQKRFASRYKEFCSAYNKVPECPMCGSPTGLRRFTSEGNTARRLGIVCFNADCEFGPSIKIQHLPFLLTDDAIYERAPSVILGTIDKMAMLGHSTSTIRQLLGMFGLARGIGPTGHLHSPGLKGGIRTTLREMDCRPVYPTFENGEQVFVDPFPSLIIQDEAHLLEESLGTFSGLFDTLLETMLRGIDRAAGHELKVAHIWDGPNRAGLRTPKVVAATATIASPDRQLEVLYQKRALRFPNPGSDIYRSFFSNPAAAPCNNLQRVALEHSLPSYEAPEAVAPWMRLFVSIMTNDATHTVTSVALLSAFHLELSLLWHAMGDPAQRASAISRLHDAQGVNISADWRRSAIDRAVAEQREDEIVALLDLHKIALAYVTNKKGGDQIMDALDASVVQRHRAAGSSVNRFVNRLISGGVDMKDIQAVMKLAEPTAAGRSYPEIDSTIRSIVATSAISHGVDVDRFNSMFFAGLPSDIAEYIQASSRVGRTHVGFVALVPTPQSRRDRYVVETHDIFHRFLERMIAPPAVERWAENAIRRVLASLIQAWAVLKEDEILLSASEAQKDRTDSYDVIGPLVNAAKSDVTGLSNEIGDFVLKAIGFEGKGPDRIGQPVHKSLYRSMIDAEIATFVQRLRIINTSMKFREYWDEPIAAFKPPMTSLRDVDEAGHIVGGAFDMNATQDGHRINPGELIHVMHAIRNQKGDTAETDQEDTGVRK